MKNYLLVLITIVTFFSCGVKKEVKSTQTITAIKTNINTHLNNWHKAAAEANFDNYFNLMDSVSVFIGTDASENWNRKEFEAYSKPYFNKGKAWSFTPLERNIYISDNKDFVWFDELIKTQMGTCRGSGVLEKKQDGWKIKHYVLSVTVPNEDMDKVIKAKKVKDDLFLNKYKK